MIISQTLLSNLIRLLCAVIARVARINPEAKSVGNELGTQTTSLLHGVSCCEKPLLDCNDRVALGMTQFMARKDLHWCGGLMDRVSVFGTGSCGFESHPHHSKPLLNC